MRRRASHTIASSLVFARSHDLGVRSEPMKAQTPHCSASSLADGHVCAWGVDKQRVSGDKTRGFQEAAVEISTGW